MARTRNSYSTARLTIDVTGPTGMVQWCLNEAQAIMATWVTNHSVTVTYPSLTVLVPVPAPRRRKPATEKE